MTESVLTLGWTRAQVAAIVDHTLLRPEATRPQVDALIAEATDLGTYAVCVSPSFLPLRIPVGDSGTGGPKVCVVSGFPSGKHHGLVKAAESRMAIEEGADEVDMVIDVGAAIVGNVDAVFSEVLTVREAIGADAVLKVILESAAILEFAGPEALAQAARAAERGGASFVKTSTGFHPSGGASVQAVTIMRQSVGERVGVKASGGIRDAGFAAELIAAGANRLGLSGSRAVLDGFPAA